jgi:membrane protein DedA with SNARE-associated domain/membrane-associated phospholipid phosphatase
MTQESLQPFIHWISAHPTWSGLIVFLISLSESLAVVGLLVPGVVMMTAIGGMMGAGILPFWETLGWAIFGAIVGDGISYWLGYHYHQRLRQFWPFRQFPKLMERGENFFRAHGGKSIVFGRFVGPVRPMIPVIAGMMDMTPKRFLVFNVLSAVAWAPLYSLPGILIGSSLGSLSPEVASRIGILVLLLLLAFWCIYEVLFLIGSWITHRFNQILDLSLYYLKKMPGFNYLLKTEQGTEKGQFGLLLLFIASSLSFLIILQDVLNFSGVADWNESVYQVLRALYSDDWITYIAIITSIGDPLILLPVSTLIGIAFLLQRQYKALFCWVVVIGGGYILGFLIKIYTEIPRPEGLFYLSSEYAFPSNHTLIVFLLFGFGALLIRTALAPKHRWIPFSIFIPFILAISFSRLYLGMHWFTDVLGSLALGIAFVSLGGFIYRRIEPKPILLPTVLMTGALSLLVCFGLYTFFFYPHARKELERQWPIESLNEKTWWSGFGSTRELYRTGAIKQQATVFDIQWLGQLDAIRTDLNEKGWVNVPKLSLKNSVMFLANEPSALHFPIMPKFHRDRLPVITMAKPLNEKQRLVLQIWHSDLFTPTQTELWVGTLRVEEINHPLPLITLFLESPLRKFPLKKFEKEMTAHFPVNGHLVFYSDSHHPILLLRPNI